MFQFTNIFKNYVYDARLLSFGRILIGLILFIDIIFRYQHLVPHYTNQGVLPVSVLKTYYPFYQYYFSIHNFVTSILLLKVLFFIHFVAVFFLIIGYKTRLFTIINFILLLSLHHRNPLILQGGDDLLRITLFYMIFLPWGRYYSLDAYLLAKQERIKNENPIEFSWIFVLFLINVAFVYLFSALLKTSDEWRKTGDAIYYALSLSTLRTPTGEIIYPHYKLLKITTYIVYYIQEILAPVLLIISFHRFIRNLSIVLIILLHLFIVSSLKVGIFPFIGISTALMLFLPKNLFNKKDDEHSPLVSLIISTKLKQSKWNFYFSMILFVLILRYNLATLPTHYFSISLVEDRLLNSIGLAQRWNMFSPGVKRYDGYLVLRGIKKDNSEWDIIHNTSNIHYEPTSQNKHFLCGDRWRKFLENYEQVHYNFIKPYFCYYLIRQWNNQHPENTIEALNILFVKKITLPNYKYKTEIENLCLCNPSFDNQLQ